MSFLKTTALAIALTIGVGAAQATTMTFDVLSKEHSSNAGRGAGLATGIVLGVGDDLMVSADAADTWVLGAGNIRIGNADGLAANWFYNNSGLNVKYGTLVGRIGTGAFFALGTSFSATVADAGELFLFNWDSNTSDNSGKIAVSVSAGPSVVPLPASGLLLVGALGVLGLKRRKAA